MDFRKLTQADVDYMEKHSISPLCYRKPDEETEYNYTLADGEDVLVIGGYTMVVPETWWAWYDISVKGKEKPVACFRYFRDWHTQFCEGMNVRRLMSFVQVGNEKAVRIAEMMGFRFECRMHNFYGDLPADLYAKYFDKVKECNT